MMSECDKKACVQQATDGIKVEGTYVAHDGMPHYQTMEFCHAHYEALSTMLRTQKMTWGDVFTWRDQVN